MAKKIALKLQEDIQTDEELNIFLENPGLLVLDIYSDWCGPCLGMVGTLRKIKLDLGSDNLSYAICKADTIGVFQRFRNKSEPTWLFVTDRKAVNLMFGSNVPKLSAMIYSELHLLRFNTRTFYELNEYQPEEVIRYQIKEDAKNKALALEREQKERERLNYLYEVTDIIMENLTDTGVTIFGPHVNRETMKSVLKIAEQMKIQCKDRKLVEISRKHFETIHFNCPNPIPDEVLEQLEGKEVFICYWKVLGDGPEVPKLLQQLAHELQIPHVQAAEDNEEDVIIPAVLEPLDLKIEEEIKDGDMLSYKSEEKLIASQKSRDEDFTDEGDEEDGEEEEALIEEDDNLLLFNFDFDEQKADEADADEEGSKRKIRTKKITMPAIWVPNNHCTHAALIYTYFRNETVMFLPPDPVPEPPYVIMAFDEYKKKDIISHVERHIDDVPMYGFFTSDDADEAEYIANSMDKYKRVTSNDKIVLKVQRATSHMMLTLVTYGPSYVSPNAAIGSEEVLKFFPSTYKTAQEEAAEEAEMLKNQPKIKTHPRAKKSQKHAVKPLGAPVEAA